MDWLSELENALSLLFNYFRTVRNDAGHPTGAKISREEVIAHLVLIPRYLELLYELIRAVQSLVLVKVGELGIGPSPLAEVADANSFAPGSPVRVDGSA